MAATASISLGVVTSISAPPGSNFETAACGETLVLAAGDYGAVNAPRLSCADGQRLTIDASAARLSSLMIRGVAGLNWQGGTLVGPREQTSGVTIDQSSRIRVAGMTITGPRVGVSIPRSDHVDVVGNRFDGIRSDGVNITMAHHIRIIGNQCVNFTPVPATFDAKGKLLVDGDHSDCIQGWTTKGTPPVSDVLIAGNTARGNMQGVGFFNPGVGGYDRITVRDNDFELGAWHGITILEGRGTIITGNRVRTLKGARSPAFPFQPIWSWIYSTGTSLACNNIVAAKASRYGTKRCLQYSKDAKD